MPFDTQPWTEPGVHEVAPGVYRVPLPMPNDGLRAVNVYIVVDGDGVVLIDSGWEIDDAREQLGAALAELGYGFTDVHRFLVTHMHRDHYTLAVRLRAEFGIPITLGAGERPSLELILSGDGDHELGELQRWGLGGLMTMDDMEIDPKESQLIYEMPDQWITGVQDFALGDRTLRAIPTPGHTHGHIVFLDQANSLLFAGDHVLPHITPSIGFQGVTVRSALGDFLDSLSLLLDEPDATLLPAHGPVTPSAHVRIKELLAHHDQRLTETLDAVRDGGQTALDSARRLTWTGKRRPFDGLNTFNKFLAVGETAAHLEHLVTTGDVDLSEVDGVAHYTPR
jgi:glyoxylase-like metal-dependent hydrolase (beta-lactamase superfamily II)